MLIFLVFCFFFSILPSDRVPHPTTTASLPVYGSKKLSVGRQIGEIVCPYVTGETSVMIAISLNCQANFQNNTVNIGRKIGNAIFELETYQRLGIKSSVTSYAFNSHPHSLRIDNGFKRVHTQCYFQPWNIPRRYAAQIR